MCKVKTYAPNNQTGKKTEQGRWKKPKTKPKLDYKIYEHSDWV
jgi:hypothetical protein